MSCGAGRGDVSQLGNAARRTINHELVHIELVFARDRSRQQHRRAAGAVGAVEERPEDRGPPRVRHADAKEVPAAVADAGRHRGVCTPVHVEGHLARVRGNTVGLGVEGRAVGWVVAGAEARAVARAVARALLRKHRACTHVSP